MSEGKKRSKTINELLAKALEVASAPGEGDEEPEVLTDPNAEENRQRSEYKEELERRRIEEERNKAIREEELRQAELSFDHNELLPSQSMKERAKYIPLRLTYEERKTLRLVNASIAVSNYTTAVDISFRNSARRHHTQLQHIVAFLSGLIAATDYEKGQQILSGKESLIVST